MRNISYAKSFYAYSRNTMVDSELATLIMQFQHSLENGNMLTDDEMSLIVKSTDFLEQTKRLLDKGELKKE